MKRHHIGAIDKVLLTIVALLLVYSTSPEFEAFLRRITE